MNRTITLISGLALLAACSPSTGEQCCEPPGDEPEDPVLEITGSFTPDGGEPDLEDLFVLGVLESTSNEKGRKDKGNPSNRP